MRYTFSGLGPGMVQTSGLTTISAHPTLTNGLAAYYKCNETTGSTAADSVGSNDGTMVNVVSTTGKFDNALDYDSNSDRVTVGSNWISTASDSDMSLSFWINPDDVAGSGTGKPIIYQNTAFENNAWGIAYYVNTLRFYKWRGSATNCDNYTGTNSITQGVLQHVVLVYDSTAETATIYINNSSETVGYVNGNNNSGKLKGFGSTTDNSVWWLNGSLGEVAIYNRKLTVSEVSDLFNENNGLPYN